MEKGKIALDWATKNLQKFEGSRIANPENYIKAKNLYTLAKNNFDYICEEWIKENC